MMKAFNMNWTHTMEGGRLIDTSRPWMRFSGDAVWLDENGDTTLHILTSPEDVRHWDGKTYYTRYAVGLLRSEQTFGHGTFSAYIKLPKGHYLWPSFWLVGEGKWPDNGEIDIMEAWSDGKGSWLKPILPRWETTSNVHWLQDGRHRQVGAACVPWLLQPFRPAENFVRYEVEWLPDRITFYTNGIRTRTVGEDIAKCLAYKRARVIFNLWTDRDDFTIETPMLVRDFSHK